MRLSVFYIFMTRLAMTKNATKEKMGLKSANIVALVLPLLLILFTLSSQVDVVESTGRKLAFWGNPIVWTPHSNSCGGSPASVFSSSKWTTGQPCRRSRPPGTNIPVSDQSP
ncbi:hypothetical protein ISN45_Aa02g012190 [Arabidopsis thaliana x Arabidopsis arenosa]|uniref:Transmembrane protein n=1 Tax=Arabidopsis thaliana x Arabidopsis arenosa TaxID=1240361 RepID=A0A8T2BI19_9BRAS|nr:hypothetical protein ISN45_Aa02g012190 [Arabidopsis thaliana x Arabidopsis arenosa]